MVELDQQLDNFSTFNVMLGFSSIILFMFGTLISATGKSRPQAEPLLTGSNCNLLLGFLGTLSVLCNVIYFMPVIANPRLIIEYFSLPPGYYDDFRSSLEQLPGITSFCSACYPFLSLYAYLKIPSNRFKISKYNVVLFSMICVFVLARAIIGSERLALIEACVAYGVPWAAFNWRKGPLRTSMPFIGFGFIFALFCVAEYFRSWVYYKDFYSNFFEFISVRFFGYFATSINNGAGIITYFPPLGVPGNTASGFFLLLRVFGIDYTPGADLLNNYLAIYATPEFNNAGGLFIPYMDFGLVLGCFIFVGMGMLTGWLYRCFVNRSALGILLYPSWFLPLLDLIRVWIWGESKFVPVLLTAVISAAFLKFGTRKRV